MIALKYDEQIGLTAAGVFLVAFTCDLAGRTALFAMNQRDQQGHAPMSRPAPLGPACAARPRRCCWSRPALRRGREDDFDPSVEFKTDPYVTIEIGPLDLSINKAVIYLLLAGRDLHRGRHLRDPGRPEDAAHRAPRTSWSWSTSSPSSRSRARRCPRRSSRRYFPYIATLFMFLAVSNLISFIPLPVVARERTFPFGIPDLSLYAATANINVTLALTLVTFIAFNYEGVRAHGPVGYLKTLIPDAPKAIKPFIFALELLSQVLRLVSLSVRLFANLLAGHLLIIMCAGFMVLLGNFAGLIAIPVGVFFYIVRMGAHRRSAGVHLRHAQRHLHRLRGGVVPLVTGGSSRGT